MFHCNETKSRPTGKDTLPALCRRLHSRDIGSRDNSAPQHGREDRQDCGFLVIFRNWRGGEGKEAGGRVSQQDLCWDPQGGPGRPGRGRAPGLPGQWQCSRRGSGASTRARCRWSRAHPRMRRDELLHREPRRCRDSQGHARPHLWVLPEPSQRGTQGKGVQWTPWLLCSVVSCHHPLLLVFLLPSGWQGGFRSHGTRSRFLTWAPCAQSRRSRPLAVLCVPYRLSGKDPHPRHTHATTYTRAHVCTVHTHTLCPQALTTADSTWPATFSRINSWLFFGN